MIAQSVITNLTTDLSARAVSKALRTTANVALSSNTTINITVLDLTVAAGETWVLDYVLPATVSGGTRG